jgi:hypothetical protein
MAVEGAKVTHLEGKECAEQLSFLRIRSLRYMDVSMSWRYNNTRVLPYYILFIVITVPFYASTI